MSGSIVTSQIQTSLLDQLISNDRYRVHGPVTCHLTQDERSKSLSETGNIELKCKLIVIVDENTSRERGGSGRGGSKVWVLMVNQNKVCWVVQSMYEAGFETMSALLHWIIICFIELNTNLILKCWKLMPMWDTGPALHNAFEGPKIYIQLFMIGGGVQIHTQSIVTPVYVINRFLIKRFFNHNLLHSECTICTNSFMMTLGNRETIKLILKDVFQSNVYLKIFRPDIAPTTVNFLAWHSYWIVNK